MNIKKILKYGFIFSTVISIILFYYFYVISKQFILESLFSAFIALVFIMFFYCTSATFIYFFYKAVLLRVDIEREEYVKKNNKNFNNNIKTIFPKTSFLGFFIFILSIPVIISFLFILQSYLFQSFLRQFNFLSQTNLSNLIYSFVHNSRTETSLGNNYNFIIAILSMLEFRFIFYKWINKIW